MSARDRSYRRAQAARIKTRWTKRLTTGQRFNYPEGWATPATVGARAATPKTKCICCNNRRRFDGATRQERIAALAMTEEA